MKFILAEKKEMTQKFSPDGTVIPVTRVVAGPCFVTQAKSDSKDGYTAVQIGFGNKRKLAKPLKGHLKDLGNFRYLKEFRIDAQALANLKVGDKITVNTFVAGDVVKVTGTSKGRGFQGVVKRHGFHGSPKTHGHKDQLRMSGSIGATGPAHVFKGTRMGGQMGNSQVTVKNLEIVEVNPEANEIFIKGAVPGSRNNLLLVSGAGDIIIEQISAPVAKEEPKEESAAVETEKSVEKNPAEVKEAVDTVSSQEVEGSVKEVKNENNSTDQKEETK